MKILLISASALLVLSGRLFALTANLIPAAANSILTDTRKEALVANVEAAGAEIREPLDAYIVNAKQMRGRDAQALPQLAWSNAVAEAGVMATNTAMKIIAAVAKARDEVRSSKNEEDAKRAVSQYTAENMRASYVVSYISALYGNVMTPNQFTQRTAGWDRADDGLTDFADLPAVMQAVDAGIIVGYGVVPTNEGDFLVDVLVSNGKMSEYRALGLTMPNHIPITERIFDPAQANMSTHRVNVHIPNTIELPSTPAGDRMGFAAPIL